ncbi:MAG: glutathione peroxidase [Eubacterium sp.]|nr:glutathione peroxidase [Eubacterium sp.]MBQ8980935.1 glutathione peroxidase [Eubacterium sp.]MBR1532170.1 glutathione peroxidase [Eubacterium sp.]MBR2278616.1 glutathione peroxidase [Eubacterium sp.]
MSVLDFTVKSQKGEDVALEQYRGKVLLIVNTATHCGFTPQYNGLEAMYKKYKEQGFEILDFPCNQFAFQAMESDEGINKVCSRKFGTTFPRFKKIKVNGKDADPLYKYLVEQTGGDKIGWNFTKFLIDREGNIVERFSSKVTPEEIEAKVEAIL